MTPTDYDTAWTELTPELLASLPAGASLRHTATGRGAIFLALEGERVRWQPDPRQDWIAGTMTVEECIEHFELED